MTRTSATHPLQIAEIEAGSHGGTIGVTFCPGKKDPHGMSGAWARDLDVDLDAIAAWNACALVTLVEERELELLAVTGLGRQVASRHMDWFHLPVRDVSVPGEAFERAWDGVGAHLRARLRSGGKVLVHCRGGLGRAGTIAARLLVELGEEPARAIERVRTARPGAIETREQEHHVLECRAIAEPRPEVTEAAFGDRAAGALLGLAIGDAVGTTLEFEGRDDKAPPQADMVGGGPFGLAPGEWTDDTAMALALADSLLARGALDEADLLDRFVKWWKEGEYSCTGSCFDIGVTTRGSLRRWTDTGERHPGPTAPDTAGNGSLMRLAPVAVRYWNDPAARRDAAARQSMATHGAAEAVDACVLYADLLAEAIAGLPRSHVLAPRRVDLAPEISRVAGGSWTSKDRTRVRGSGYVVHSLEAALWCVARSSDFRGAVLLAANLREDADTTAAITGQLAGALCGASGIPEEWRRRVAWGPRIEHTAGRLFAAAGSLGGPGRRPGRRSPRRPLPQEGRS